MVDRVTLHLGSMGLVDVRKCTERHNDRQGSNGKVSYAQFQEVANDQSHCWVKLDH
jgi:hypothetical protein